MQSTPALRDAAIPAARSRSTPAAPRLAPLAVAAHLAVAALLGVAHGRDANAQAAAAVIRYDVPAGPLAEVLNRFAQQAGVALVIDAELVKGRHSEGLKGSYGVEEGFGILLRGSGYAVGRTAAGYVLVPAPAPGAAAGEAASTLPAVRVTARADRPGELPQPFAGGQLARGGRLGMLGNADVADAPFGVTSYTAQMVEDQQARTVADVVANDPSVRFSGQAGGILDAFFIRGFPVGEGNLGEIAFDGLYGVAPNYRVLADYAERIEVLKGPTALLYGMAPSSSIGGGINIVPKRAADTDLARFTADYASDSQIGGHLDLSRRFGADRSFGVRFNGSYRDGDTPLDDQSRTARVGALALDYRGERLRASADIIDQHEAFDAPSRQPRVASGLAVPDAPDGRRNLTQAWEWSEIDDRSVLLRAEYDVDDALTLFANAGEGRTEVARLFGNPLILNAAGDTTTTPQNFRFDIERESIDAGVRARFDTAAVHHVVTLQASRYRDRLGRNATTAAEAVLSNLYDPVDRPEQFVAAPATVPKISETELSGVALADTMSMLGGDLQLTLGVRRQRVESDNFNPATGAVASTYDEGATTPLVGVVYKPWQNVALYANRIEGLSKGDTAPTTAANAGEVFAPYKARQYEIGVKLEHGGTFATVSAFDIRKPAGQLTGNVFTDDAEQRNRGIELNAAGEIAPGVRLLGGAAFFDAELTRTSSAATQGKTPVGVSEVQANLGAEWDVGALPGLTLSCGVVHTGKQYVDQANTQSIPDWTRFDLGARYRTEIAGRTTIFRATVRNVLDEDYWSGVASWGGLAQGAPRTVQLSATMDF